ncbi:hypothetical protein BDQ12DRAFT_630382 [Crucibulum laeve]|uniref:Arf-GAP domain-containing protein n=1 Tax=Crucibulum laeve TaxID=68775 RepID=A0A5C3M0F9_9AGAR|nr:hypothetical protein BDQ12DRAFT_630382 [Crucibulum laeve]
MSRQDRTTTERFTRTLRELVKRPENKVCADCKRNDPRWASWNLGVFLCIRCSGIHRGMGTHISKVKSVDLDVWTPEQMESIQKWGNHLANLYWEAHLKPGHVPPEHKMESFIRSKYESRRWALDGPPPTDPSVLESGAGSLAPVQSPPQPTAPTTRISHAPTNSISTHQVAPPITTRQPQPHQLLSTGHTNRQSPAVSPSLTPVAVPIATPPQPKASENDLFSLDFHALTSSNPVNNSSATQAPKKDVKQDILSLFSVPAPATAAPSGFGQFGTPATTSPWGAQVQQPQQPQQQTSMVGANGVGAWGASSGWTSAAAMPPQQSVWGNAGLSAVQQPQTSLFNTSDVWGSSAPAPPAGQDLFGSSFTSTSSTVPKKDDAFGDIWGGFK